MVGYADSQPWCFAPYEKSQWPLLKVQNLLGQIEPPIFVVHAEESQVLGDEGRAPGRQQDDPVAMTWRGRELVMPLHLDGWIKRLRVPTFFPIFLKQ